MDYQDNLKRLNNLLNQQFQNPQNAQWHFYPGVNFNAPQQPMQPLDPTPKKRKYVESEVISYKLLKPGDPSNGDKNPKDDR